MQQIRAHQLADWLADASRPAPLLLDVREPWEFELCHLPGSQLIPMHLVPTRLAELNPDDEFVIVCHHGGRSMQVAHFLASHGYEVVNIAGGIHAWSTQVDPSVPVY